MPPVIVPKSSVLNLDIEGSIGSFFVSDHSKGSRSVEVKYILSHVGLDLSGGQEEKLLSNLKPIREVFGAKTLSFDEIMQRDIDDQRVSLDLVTYLLEEGKKGLVKLFPPIVVVVVPIQEGSDKPAKGYPTVEQHEKVNIDGYDYKIIRSGKIGGEGFEFRQMYLDGELSEHNYAKLRLNTDKNKLAIVDGQHRAMALLGLYRNIKGWPDGTAAYKDYYKRWTKEIIREKDLTNLRLPVMVCVFPELDSTKGGQIKVTEACRSIFLALNKNAKPVTRARNILLNDRDLIAEFMRDTLTIIKNGEGQDEVLSLHNIQLDAENDKTKLTSEMAITGVMHLYTLIERLMMNEQGLTGFSAGKNRLDLVKAMDNAFDRFRLNAIDIIGTELTRDTTRRNYLEDTKEKLVDEFHHRYSKNIIYCLEKFYPFRIHAEATREIKSQVRSKSDVQAKAILFDNQGVENVFKAFRDRVTAEIKERKDCGKAVPPGLKDSKDEFDNTYSRVFNYKKDFVKKRAQKFFRKNNVCTALVSAAQDIFDKNFTTSAFQNGLILTFYNMIEVYQVDCLGARIDNGKINDLLQEYIDSLNKFFTIESDHDTRRICRLFFGKHKGKFNSDEMRFQENDACLRNVLIPGELNPSEWPKFRFIFLELWHSEDKDFNTMIEREILKCRVSLYRKYCKRTIDEYCKIENIEEENLHQGTRKSFYNKCKKILFEEINAMELTRKMDNDTLFDIF